jgi:hypothetical protein
MERSDPPQKTSFVNSPFIINTHLECTQVFEPLLANRVHHLVDLEWYQLPTASWTCGNDDSGFRYHDITCRRYRYYLMDLTLYPLDPFGRRLNCAGIDGDM